MKQRLYLALSLSLLAWGCGNADNKQEGAEHDQQVLATPQSKLDDEGTQKLMSVISDYYMLKDAFVATDATKADSAANRLSASTDSFKIYLQSDTVNSNVLASLLDTISMRTRQIISENDATTEKKRIHFEKVSDAMYALLKKAEIKNAGIYRQYCPMAFDDKGAYWLSNEEEIRNPYFGKKMLECGEVTDSL